ncbi:hypothetical protein [Polyangium fumosum]|uniref:Ferritin-like domain-containing protein n=1 Tax=Polyangium fumosum TaxID=889272 RepID=A0A4U1JCM9_9BACT|nr:hypothetical protein [Polyangium fumosum]TKD07847.1 hypothetical protein E8A74_16255 [Polyangium fumosum]
MGSLSSSRLGPTLCALGAAAILLAPGEARADDNIHWVSPGLMLSLSFGDKLNFGLGLDVRYSLVFAGNVSCFSGPRGAVGAFAQASWLNFSSAGRFAAGLHGGADLRNPGIGANAEVGWTYRTALSDLHPGGHGIHVGLGAIGGGIVDLGFRGTIPWPGDERKPEFTITAGAHFPPMYGEPGLCIIGRPLRVDGRYVLPGVAGAPRRGRERGGRIDEPTRSALVSAWQDDARGECASIPAFLALARDLAAVGAPRDLVDRALAAAADEVRHTELCASIAGDLASRTLAPELLPPPRRSGLDRARELQRLCVESWEDGCLGEGAAAERARRQARGAKAPGIGAALGVIAADEARHAELGWRVVQWCLSEGGRPVREALGEAVAASPEGPAREASPEAEPAAWRGYGRIGPQDINASWEQNLGLARKTAQAFLSARG